jgi:hypothetical protein
MIENSEGEKGNLSKIFVQWATKYLKGKDTLEALLMKARAGLYDFLFGDLVVLK